MLNSRKLWELSRTFAVELAAYGSMLFEFVCICSLGFEWGDMSNAAGTVFVCFHDRCIVGTCLGPDFDAVPYITFPRLGARASPAPKLPGHEVFSPQRVCCNPHVLRKIPCPSNAKHGVCWKNTKQYVQIPLRGFLQECSELLCKVNSSVSKSPPETAMQSSQDSSEMLEALRLPRHTVVG